MIRALLVDDQPLVRAGLRRILETSGEIEIAGEVDDGDGVLAAVDGSSPDVVVMDVRMRRVNGDEATRWLQSRLGSPPVLVLTTFDDDETVAAALLAGAAGFIVKDAPGEDLIRATLAVARGDAWLDPRVTARVLAVYRRQEPAPTPGEALAALTPREVDVLRLVGRGATNAEIAGELCISEATAKSHLGRLLTKLDLRDRPAAIVLAHRVGLV